MLLFFVDRVPSLSVTEFTYFRKYELLFAADFLQKAFFFLVLQLTMCCYKTYEHHQHKQKKQKFQRK